MRTAESDREAPSSRRTPWHALQVDQSAHQLGSDTTLGLSTVEARSRLTRYGPNDMERAERTRLWRMVAAQFSDFMILVLVGAAVVSGFIGELRDALAIVVILVLNAGIGVFQEYRAQRAVAALRRMAAPGASVIRDGVLRSIAATELVPGDLVLLEAGNVVPADVRLVEVTALRLDESALTGESQPVDKVTGALSGQDLPVADRVNMAYKGTAVTRGRGQGLVVGTGMASEVGRIAALLSHEAIQTPLKQRLTRFGRQLAVAVLGICALVFMLGLAQGQPPLLMLLTAVTLAVAAIPEALPAVITISLALGARELSRRRALVRRLPAVETLGSVTYICADKTGTLTENRMALASIFAAGQAHRSVPLGVREQSPWKQLGHAMALNNEVQISARGPVGDPTELALFLAAQQAGFRKQELLSDWPVIAELSFDADRKRMTTLHRHKQGAVALVKGAPENILAVCSDALGQDGVTPIDQAAILAQAQTLAAQGSRVLALAFREFERLPAELSATRLEAQLTFLGLVALIDPPRAEAPQAVADCQTAGIVPVMITGDHPDTARAIAAQLGLVDNAAAVLTGAEIADLSDAQLAERVGSVRVYARVDPEQKIRIVSALQEAGEFVAMTGDGVNDAPALKRANIGIAMGERGTDVAREAAEMVLLDDNFATIVAAVREGRRIFDDIRKFIKYTMTSNSGEIWALLLAPLLGLPIPLLPIHILWINLLTDGLPGLALAAEPAERNLMRRPPRPPQENIFAHGMWQHIVWVGLFIGALSVGTQAWAYGRGVEHWQTMVFTVLVVAQLFHVLAIRAEQESLMTIGIFSNPQLLGAVLITLALQGMVIYVPVFQPIFRTAPLPWFDLLFCFGLAATVLIVVEIEKWLVRHGHLYTSLPLNLHTR